MGMILVGSTQESGGTQGRRPTHENKSSKGLVLTKETVIPLKVITGIEKKISLEKCGSPHSDTQES